MRGWRTSQDDIRTTRQASSFEGPHRSHWTTLGKQIGLCPDDQGPSNTPAGRSFLSAPRLVGQGIGEIHRRRVSRTSERGRDLESHRLYLLEESCCLEFGLCD